jgi:hypothetical protein
VISEDVKRVRRYATSGNVEYTGKKLTGDLIHVGDHQKKTLRSGISGGESTGCKRTVNSTSGTGLGLHFDNVNGSSENVLKTLSCPLISVVSHRAGRCDGVNTRNFCESVAYMSGSLVTVHGKLFSFDCHVCNTS